jgi:hypothetical protein
MPLLRHFDAFVFIRHFRLFRRFRYLIFRHSFAAFAIFHAYHYFHYFRHAAFDMLPLFSLITLRHDSPSPFCFRHDAATMRPLARYCHFLSPLIAAFAVRHYFRQLLHYAIIFFLSLPAASLLPPMRASFIDFADFHCLISPC